MGDDQEIAQTAQVGPHLAVAQHAAGIAHRIQVILVHGQGIDAVVGAHAVEVPAVVHPIVDRRPRAEGAEQQPLLIEHRCRTRPHHGGQFTALALHRHTTARTLPDRQCAVVAQGHQHAPFTAQHQLLDPGPMGLHEPGLRACEHGDAAAVVARQDAPIGVDHNGVGAHAQVVAGDHGAVAEAPFAHRAIHAGAHQGVAVIAPQQRDDVAGMTEQGVVTPALPVEHAHRAIERAGGHPFTVRRKAGHVDVVGMSTQHRLQREVGHPPDARAAVAAGTHQPAAIAAELAMVDQMVVHTLGDRAHPGGSGLPQDHTVVVAGAGPAAGTHGDAADRSAMLDCSHA